MRASLALLALAGAAALYSKGDGVIELDDSSFSKIAKDDGVWLVEVYAPWCGHCKSLVPEWKKAAKALKGIVNVAAVDGTAAQATAQKLGVQGFPSIFVYGADKSKPTPYNGGRDAKAIVDAGLKAAQQLAAGRLSGKAGGGGGGGKGGASAGGGGSGGKKKGGASSGGGSASEPGGGKHVATLEDDSFDATVLDSEEAWMVEFYAPWCGHCKTLAPEWAEAAAQTADSGVRFGAVDATAHQGVAAKFNVKGFPTIVAFPPGKKTASSGKVYSGGRDASSLAAHAASLLEGAGPVRGAVAQLTGAPVWDEHCGAKRICLVAVLPHIVDDGAVKRQARLDALADAAGAAGKRALFRFLWTEAGAQPALERMFNTGVTPAMYAVSDDKKVFTPFRGVLDVAHVKSFVVGLTSGRSEGTQPFPTGVTSAGAGLATVAAWDGKDAVVEATEEFSLDEL